jgi:hypothetical protein
MPKFITMKTEMFSSIAASPLTALWMEWYYELTTRMSKRKYPRL